MEFLQWCWVFCYNHNRPLFLTCLTWTKFHPMGILLGFTKGKFFVDDFFSPGRSWVRWSKGLGNPGEKKPGKSWAIEIVRCFCIPFLSKPPKKKHRGLFFLLQPQDSKQLSPQTSAPPPTLLQDLMKPPNKILPNPQQFPDTQCMVHLPYI